MEINNETNNKKRLGRGLGSLLGENNAQGLADYGAQAPPVAKQAEIAKRPESDKALASQPVDIENKIWFIAIDKLVPGIYQPRKSFDKQALEGLAESIKQNGILQPIAVRKRNAGGFEIIAGERRWRAAQIAGLHEVPAIIKNVSDRDALQLALIENVQREDLDPVEEAESYQRLIEEFSLSQLEVAEKVGKERSTVANALRLLALPKELKEMLSQKQISSGHAKAILAIHDKAQQIRLAKLSIEKGFSVRAIETEIKKILKGGAGSSASIDDVKTLAHIDIASKLAQELADQLQKSLGTKVEISYKAGKGQIEIQFYTDDQLTQIYEKLKA